MDWTQVNMNCTCWWLQNKDDLFFSEMKNYGANPKLGCCGSLVILCRNICFSTCVCLFIYFWLSILSLLLNQSIHVCFSSLNRNPNGWRRHCTNGWTMSTAPSRPMWTSATQPQGRTGSPWRRSNPMWERSWWKWSEICRSFRTRRASTGRSRPPMPRWVW